MKIVTQSERQSIEWECIRLVNCYANYSDAAKWEELAKQFAIDGRMARPSSPDTFVSGRDAILKSFQSRPPRTTRHVCANVVIDVQSHESASGESAMLLFTGSGAPMVGSFLDKFALTEEGWQFLERRGVMHFST